MGHTHWTQETPTVIARDRTNKRILLGGLGSLGIGSMWFDDDGTRYAGLLGYESAPEGVSPAKLALGCRS